MNQKSAYEIKFFKIKKEFDRYSRFVGAGFLFGPSGTITEIGTSGTKQNLSKEQGRKMWEFSMFDWSKKGANGSPLDAQYVEKLIFAKTPKEARDAFFVVNEAVGQNGRIFPCALTVLRTVLASLSFCVRPAKLECLELIANIAASNSAGVGDTVAEDCLSEIRNAFWIFASGIQFDDPVLIGSYVDILGCLGEYIPELNGISREYIELSLTRNIPQYDVEMVKNTILGLEKKSNR